MWHLIDASKGPLGRIATQISIILQGKHKPIYHPMADVGDHVVVLNCAKTVLMENKMDTKLYRWHTTYAKGFREVNARHYLNKKPTMVH